MPVQYGIQNPFVEDSKQMDDAYWRTLISDTSVDQLSRAQPGLAANFCAFATVSNMVEDNRTSGDIDGDSVQMGMLIQLTPYMLGFTTAMFRRRLCVTEAGRIGNVVAESQEGDYIAVLEGVERPLIVREAAEKRYYHFIGLAYVHGIMDGEALKLGSGSFEDIQFI